MNSLSTIAEAIKAHASRTPAKIGAKDSVREVSFRELYRRACKLANALNGLGLRKGDRVCVLAYNCVEWVEIYAATALAGLIAVPVNFRLVGREIVYVTQDCDARAFIVQDELLDLIEPVMSELGSCDRNIIAFGVKAASSGLTEYESVISAAADTPPDTAVSFNDPWTMMYTSGTTGNPKGAVRRHLGSSMLALATSAEMGIGRNDQGLLVMPLCHANSLYFMGTFLYCGATTAIYDRKSFDPEELLQTLSANEVTFTSLVPTHYIMMFGLSSSVWQRNEVKAVRKLMVSSAPARRETKLQIMEKFPQSGLYEMYGSTETGWVTMLHPEDQLTKLGSVGRELVGSKPIRLLDGNGHEVKTGEVGELFSCNPYTFDHYWRLPQKTAEAFRGEYCSVGDFARRDEDGYIHLVDRKSNLIISGGENIYPMEVEALLGQHPLVKDVAVVGLPHEKWGEQVHAVVIPVEGANLSPEQLVDWCAGRIAGYKRPRSVSLVQEHAMPRTSTGKIIHRKLREQLSSVRQTTGE